MTVDSGGLGNVASRPSDAIRVILRRIRLVNVGMTSALGDNFGQTAAQLSDFAESYPSESI